MSNVDSQASFDNIVIQVIGETSSNAGDPKKFVQTFVLAQQPSGYFVLNDILRFIDEEGEEEATEQAEPEAPSAEVEAPAPIAEEAKEIEAPEEPAVEAQPASFDPDVVDKKLEEVSAVPQKTASVNGDAAPEPAAEEPAAAPEAETGAADEAIPEPVVAAQEVAEETAQEAEKPKDPSPTPAPRQAPAPAAAPTPARPSKPMTWASRIAAAAGPPKVSPAMPLTKAAPVPATARPAAAAAAATPAPSSQTTAPTTQPTEAATTAAPAKEVGTEWQTAGGDSKRQNRPQSISGPPTEKEGTLGYVKYVTEKVGREELEAVLAQYGELAYFDINRQKVRLLVFA